MQLVLDVETGGLTPTTSLLSLGMILIDEKSLEVIDEIELFLKPDNGIYAVTPQALQVNQIDLVEHEKWAESYSRSYPKLLKFFSGNEINGCIGHNIAFDLGFVFKFLIRKTKWDKLCGYRNIDTAGIARFLGNAGILPKMSYSLENLCAYYRINPPDHTALKDAQCTLGLYRRMLSDVPQREGNQTGENILAS